GFLRLLLVILRVGAETHRYADRGLPADVDIDVDLHLRLAHAAPAPGTACARHGGALPWRTQGRAGRQDVVHGEAGRGVGTVVADDDGVDHFGAGHVHRAAVALGDAETGLAQAISEPTGDRGRLRAQRGCVDLELAAVSGRDHHVAIVGA